jgi:putative Mg2+ transporter-C (MgtC) family protein
MTDVSAQLEIVLRLVIACALAACLGWERETAHKSAGLRTHILVALAATLFVALTDVVVRRYLPFAAAVRADPLRPILAVATGIGFLGGGIIFVAQRSDRAHNLTTAASIWTTAAIGCAVGYGQYVLAAGATILALLTLHVLVKVDRRDGEE